MTIGGAILSEDTCISDTYTLCQFRPSFTLKRYLRIMSYYPIHHKDDFNTMGSQAPFHLIYTIRNQTSTLITLITY